MPSPTSSLMPSPTPSPADPTGPTDPADLAGPAPDPWHGLLGVLVCPLCGARLQRDGGALRCVARHSFDIARQGYVSLLTGNAHAANADTASMVRARAEFLGAGHYAPLTRALADLATGLCPPRGTVLDAGAGTGHYLSAVLDALPGAVGLGLDLSRYALRRAARAHPRARAAGWDVWRPLPVRTGSVDLLFNVFAPRNGPEFRRVLRAGGALVVVTPTARHLAEVRREAGLLSVDGAKEQRLHRTLSEGFRQVATEVREHVLDLSARDVRNLVAMGPSARHLADEELDRRVPTTGAGRRTTASFRISVYRPR